MAREEYINGQLKQFKNIDSAKKIKCLELKNLYQATLKQGCETSIGIKVDCLPKNVADFSNNLQYMELSGVTETLIMDYNNVPHPNISLTDYKKICIELGNYVFNLRKQYWEKRDKIIKETDFETLKKYQVKL